MEITKYQIDVLKVILGEMNTHRLIEALKRGDSVENIVFRTTNYSQFGKIDANRDLIERHITDLMDSMSKKLLPTYAMVDEEFGTWDGQNRIEALTRLGLPISYYFAENLQLDDLATLQEGEAWNKNSYLKSNIDLGNENYVFFNDMLVEYDINAERLLKVFKYAQGINRDEVDRMFKSGKFKLDGVEKVVDFLEALEDFKPYAQSFYRSGAFMTAFLKLFFRESYNHEFMKKNLESKKNYASNLKPCTCYADYLHILTMLIYTKDNATKKGFIPIVFDKDENTFLLG